MIDICETFPSPEEFISRYWGKKPLLIRGLIKQADSLISAEELAGLSLEPAAESRVVMESKHENDHTKRWQVKHGPFDENFFESLPNNNWSLLVQGVDRFLSEVSDLTKVFDFIPNWRFDDVMVSYSAPGGGVGPHYDLYDVFLVQGTGQRLWRIGDKKEDKDAPLIDDIPLKILKSYEASIEIKVTTGDVLYLPPMWGHDGISITEAITYSVGFRSPPIGELLYRAAFELATSTRGERLFEDRRFSGQKEPGEITSQSIQDALGQVLELLGDEQVFAACFGAYVTEPKEPQDPSGAISIKAGKDEPLGISELRMMPLNLDHIAQLEVIHRLEGGRFAYYVGKTQLLCFIEGQMLTLPLSLKPTVAMLCRERTYARNQLAKLACDKDSLTLLGYCLEQGWLYTE